MGDVEHAKKIVYPKSFIGAVLVPKYASEIEAHGSFDELKLTFCEGLYYDTANYDLQSINLLGKVKKISFYSIKNCKNVRSLVLPEGLEELESGTICFDQHVTVTLPESLKKVDKNAFGWSFENPKRKLIAYSTCPALPELRKISANNDNIELSVINPPWPSISRTFVSRIKPLYRSEGVESLYSSVDAIVKDAFSNVNILTNCRKAIANEAAKADLLGLKTIMLSEYGNNEFCEKATALITEDIEKSIEEEKQKKYNEAVNLSSGDKLADLIKAKNMFIDLGTFKDSKDLVTRLSTAIVEKKNTQYDEAVSLYKDGTEESIRSAISKMDELGLFKDAPTLAKEYRNHLEKEKQYKEAIKLLESDDLQTLSLADKKLSLLVGFKNADELLITCRDKIDAAQEKIYLKAINLASEGTESALNEAVSLMNTISSYKDSDSKVKELQDILNDERAYSSALSLTNSREISDLIVAKGIFENLGNYKDSVIKAAACDKLATELCENKYQDARKAETVYTLTSQKDAISKYNQLGYYKDSFERKEKCNTNCTIIQKIQDLEKEIEAHKKELAAITGVFKKKERQAKEVIINEKEKRLSELRSELTEKPVTDTLASKTETLAESSDVQIDVETISEAQENEPAVIETITETVTETVTEVEDVSAQAQVQPKPSKKSKKGLLILIILMLLAVAAAVLYLTGVLYISPDADNCQIMEYTHSGGTTADKALTIEESYNSIDDYDNLEIVYRVTNTSKDDIWDLAGDIAFLDKNDKELCTTGFSYRGLLKPGKSVYVYASSYDVKPKKIARVKLASYNYSVGQTNYWVDMTSGEFEKNASDYEYYSNADYEMANCLSFDINNRGLDEYSYYNVDVTVSNGGETPVNRVTYYIDFLDKDGNIIYPGGGYIENELGSSESMLSETDGYEQIEGDGSTKLIDSTVINRYEYYLNGDDRYGNNYYSVDLVNGIAYGTHYDD